MVSQKTRRHGCGESLTGNLGRQDVYDLRAVAVDRREAARLPGSGMIHDSVRVLSPGQSRFRDQYAKPNASWMQHKHGD